MKIKHYPGKVVMEDPWLSINDRTMDLVYAANWIGARNLSNYNENTDQQNNVKYNTISRSKSCRDVSKNIHKDYSDNEYSETNYSVSQNISQLAKYQQNIEEKARANNNLVNTQGKLKHSYSFKDMPNGYKPSTLRRIKRRNFTEWNTESFGSNSKQPPVPPQRRDSLKYAHRQRKIDSKKNQYPLPDPIPAPADPSSESYYEYYSRVSQQVNDTDNSKLKQLQKVKEHTVHKDTENKHNSSPGLFSNDTVYHLINSMATLDLSTMKSTSESASSEADIDDPDAAGLYMKDINETIIPETPTHQNYDNTTKIQVAKPTFRSKSLRVKSEGRAPLQSYLDDIETKKAPHENVTITQPTRNLSPSEQLSMMHYDMLSNKSKTVHLPKLSNGTAIAGNLDKDSDYRTSNGTTKKSKRDKYGMLYNTVRVKGTDRYDKCNNIFRSIPPPRVFDDHRVNIGCAIPRSTKSSTSSDSDFSIPRPKLIVPVHTYGIRKRRTGNLNQRDSTSTEALDTSVLLDENGSNDPSYGRHKKSGSGKKINV